MVLKIYSGIWFGRLNEVLDLLSGEFPGLRVILRLSRNIQEEAKGFGWNDGQVARGNALSGVVTFLETGICFEADVLRGQKTGFFLDQRENRRLMESLSADKKVLNAFSFSGGFSLYAARGGAVSVTDLDISAHALESANRNFALNLKNPNVARARHESVQADVFKWLQQETGGRFDVVILDPPSLAKREAERVEAIRAYEKLAGGGIARLEKGGLLVAASCSAHVTTEEFFTAVRTAARQSRRKFSEVQITGHAPDHAASFKEAEYLKCIYLRFED